MSGWLAAAAWVAGTPLRRGLVALIRVYRFTLSGAIGGRCRFYPSCSEYAEAAITRLGVVRGVSLSVWRVLRCSPLSKGGVDHPPAGHRVGIEGAAKAGRSVYDVTIQAGPDAFRVRGEAGR